MAASDLPCISLPSKPSFINVAPSSSKRARQIQMWSNVCALRLWCMGCVRLSNATHVKVNWGRRVAKLWGLPTAPLPLSMMAQGGHSRIPHRKKSCWNVSQANHRKRTLPVRERQTCKWYKNGSQNATLKVAKPGANILPAHAFPY